MAANFAELSAISSDEVETEGNPALKTSKKRGSCLSYSKTNDLNTELELNEFLNKESHWNKT